MTIYDWSIFPILLAFFPTLLLLSVVFLFIQKEENMAIKRNRNYTVIDNEIFNNSSISMKAKGLLCQLLSFPD